MTTTSSGVAFHHRYFSGKRRWTRIGLGVTPCVSRHYARTMGPLGLRPGARVLELGCGLGRFTELLLADGYDVTGLDLSDDLIARMRETFPPSPRLTTIAGRAEDVGALTSGRFDAVVGFFFLHHLPTLAPALTAARDVLAPGGQIAFCDPNAFNPLVYLQVTLTPGMRWRGEPSIPKMRPSVVFPILSRLGFVHVRTDLYGALPPIVANTAIGGRLERAIEGLRPMRPISAYRVVTARVPAGTGATAGRA